MQLIVGLKVSQKFYKMDVNQITGGFILHADYRHA